MARVVADTSALVSLGTIAEESGPLTYLLEHHHVLVPDRVRAELEQTASFDDASGHGATAVLDRLGTVTIRPVELDDGENAAVTLANEVDAEQLLCDEFNRIALVHASLAGPRLVTTPTLLLALTRTGSLTREQALVVLRSLREARSWSGNSYVDRVEAALRQEPDG